MDKFIIHKVKSIVRIFRSNKYKSRFLNGAVSTYIPRFRSLFLFPKYIVDFLLMSCTENEYLIYIRTFQVIDILSASLKLTCR